MDESKFIVFSVNSLLKSEEDNIMKRHEKKLNSLLEMKAMAEKLETNPNEVNVNLSEEELSSEQVKVSKFGLRYKNK